MYKRPSNLNKKQEHQKKEIIAIATTADYPDSLDQECSRSVTSSQAVTLFSNNSKHQSTSYSDFSSNNVQGSQELDRSLSSVAQSKAWRCSSSSTEYFDSIDNSGSAFHDATASLYIEREALAECDSLEPDIDDLV